MPRHADWGLSPDLSQVRDLQGKTSSGLDPQALVAALSHLHDGAIELLGRDIQLSAVDHPAVDPHAALLDQAPRLAAAEPELVGEQRRQMDRAVGRDRRLLDLLRELVANVQAIEVLLGS